jgi:hypothetical protein
VISDLQEQLQRLEQQKMEDILSDLILNKKYHVLKCLHSIKTHLVKAVKASDDYAIFHVVYFRFVSI